MKVEFRLADRDTAKQLFYFMLGQPEQPFPQVNEQMDCGEFERRAAAFAVKIPDLKFSSAEIIPYLLPYRHCPAAAIENCSQWVDGLLQEKKAKEEAAKNGRNNQRDQDEATKQRLRRRLSVLTVFSLLS